MQDAGLDVVLREPVGACALIVPVELPAADRRVEGRPGARVRQPDHPQAGVAHARSPRCCSASCWSRPACPPSACRCCPGRAASSATRWSPTARVAKIVVHRRDRHRRVDPAGVGRQHHPGVARARRQVGVRRVRRRRLASAPRPRRRWRCSATPARTAAPAAGSSWSASVYDDFVAAFVARHRGASRVGAPLDEATEMGPMISAGQRQTSLDYLEHRRRTKAPGRVTGGDVARPAPASTSPPPCWPTSTTRCASPRRRSSARSPSIIPFDDEADAVRIANDSDYGLSGSLWTGDARPRDPGRPRRCAPARCRSTRNRSVRIEAPFGGYKRSGLGRELGMHAMDHYTEVKNVFSRRAGRTDAAIKRSQVGLRASGCQSRSAGGQLGSSWSRNSAQRSVLVALADRSARPGEPVQEPRRNPGSPGAVQRT